MALLVGNEYESKYDYNMNQDCHVTVALLMNNMMSRLGCDSSTTDVLTRNLNTNQPSQVQLANNGSKPTTNS